MDLNMDLRKAESRDRASFAECNRVNYWLQRLINPCQLPGRQAAYL